MRMNISVPDELAEQVRARDLPISSICQDALRKAVDLAEKKERIMSDMQAVIERLRDTRDEERQRHTDEGRELGILWAKGYATADELRKVAEGDGMDYEAGVGSSAGIAEFYAEVENNYDEKYQEEHNDAFVVGAREVWEAVKDSL
ncbi:type II toxin-antitoxin system CcdA family antitoxin [Streptomyces adustus]|uniref:type II toxin-antitoxin system CcdA family antitoxin n=1 Tax=Streptomyces adustus TaxID=1609272 RepID=UPI00371B2E37